MSKINYSASSRWTNSRFSGSCRECENDIYEGDRIVLIPGEQGMYCDGCGEEVAGADPKKRGFTQLV